MKKYFFVFTRVVLGGLSNSVSRLVVNALPLYTFVFARHFLIAIFSLFIFRKNTFKEDFFLIRHNKSLRAKILSSIVLSSAGTLLFYNALKMLPVSIISIFENGMFTFMVVILSVIFLKEEVTKRSFWYLAICLIGLGFIVTKGDLTGIDISLIGLMLLTINATLSAVNVTVISSALKEISALTNTTIKSATSALTALIIVIVTKEDFTTFFTLMTIGLALFLMYSVISGFFIKYLQGRSLQELGSSKTAIFTLLTPIFSSLFAMIIFQEWFNTYQYAGMVLVAYGVYKIR